MHKIRLRTCLTLFLAVAIAISIAGISHAATVTYNLTIDNVTVTMPDTTGVVMAGIGIDAGPITVPGPVLEAVEGDDLVLNLTNNLSDTVTIIVHGQMIENPTPVMVGGRVMSFTPEAASVTFPGLKAGTYLYECGTHTAKMVPLGLYGVLVVHPMTPGQAYNDPVSAYDSAEVVVISDVDPALNAAVDSGDYGTAAYPSTVNYSAAYFLINGKAYPETMPLDVIKGTRVLLRFANAGTKSYTPTLYGVRMLLIAEDGNLAPFPLEISSLILPPGKTKDVIVVPDDYMNIPVFDRRLNMSNAGAAGTGGLFTYLQVLPADNAGIFRNGTWYLDSNSNRQFDNGIDETFTFGTASDIPVRGDWNGDGADEAGFVRNGMWYLDLNGDGAFGAGDVSFPFGQPADIPVTGDWQGDGIDDIGVFRNRWWYLDSNSNQAFDAGVDEAFRFGLASDIPIPGRW